MKRWVGTMESFNGQAWSKGRGSKPKSGGATIPESSCDCHLLPLCQPIKKKSSNLCRQVALIFVISPRLCIRPCVEIDPVSPLRCVALHFGAKCASDWMENGRCGFSDALAKGEPHLRTRLQEWR